MTEGVLERIARAAEKIARGILYISGGELKFELEGTMFVLPDDQPDVRFSVSAVSATDSEGHEVALIENLVSDNEDAVSFVFDEGSSASAPRAGAAHIGAPGVANVNYMATDAQGNIVKSSGAQFTITTGAIASVSGGDLAFEGISEQ